MAEASADRSALKSILAAAKKARGGGKKRLSKADEAADGVALLRALGVLDPPSDEPDEDDDTSEEE